MAWLFQGNPKRWRVFDFVKEKGVEALRETNWSVVRYLEEMAVGDDAVLWISGGPDVRGVYAIGRITSEPYEAPTNDEYWTDEADRRQHRSFVDLEFERLLFDRPILAVALKQDPEFGGSSIFRMPQGGNPHRIEQSEWQALSRHLPTS